MPSTFKTQTGSQPSTSAGRRLATVLLVAAGLVGLTACDRSRQVEFMFPDGKPNGTPPLYVDESAKAGRLPPEVYDADATKASIASASFSVGGTASADQPVEALARALTARGVAAAD
ncbi:hypothetical protein [Chachezhania sediminis]|uniref:hypothetical protein n=1 Tax=Chachezhania sediminis TaxID=2599291 RepID=UPI00131E3BF8|nr:hypothetical protein [Chachezhania sediminis]